MDNRLSKKGSPKGLRPSDTTPPPLLGKGEGDKGGEVFRQPPKK